MFRRLRDFLLAPIIEILSVIKTQLHDNQMKQSEFNAKVIAAIPIFTRVLAEIKELIAKLKETDPDISPEGAAAIAKFEEGLTEADALAPELPTEPPTP